MVYCNVNCVHCTKSMLSKKMPQGGDFSQHSIDVVFRTYCETISAVKTKYFQSLCVVANEVWFFNKIFLLFLCNFSFFWFFMDNEMRFSWRFSLSIICRIHNELSDDSECRKDFIRLTFALQTTWWVDGDDALLKII